MYVILVYDIKGDDNGKKVLAKTYNICKRYLTHIQNSVFEGDLTESQIMHLQMELKSIVRKELDSVILFKSRNSRWLKKEFWANQEDLTSNFF